MRVNVLRILFVGFFLSLIFAYAPRLEATSLNGTLFSKQVDLSEATLAKRILKIKSSHKSSMRGNIRIVLPIAKEQIPDGRTFRVLPSSDSNKVPTVMVELTQKNKSGGQARAFNSDYDMDLRFDRRSGNTITGTIQFRKNMNGEQFLVSGNFKAKLQ